MKQVLVIGIGSGDPEHLTLQAVRALNEADVVFVVEKPGARDELAALRREICDRYMKRPYRLVSLADPARDRGAGVGGGRDYVGAVEDWRDARRDVWEAALRDELSDDGCGAFLVWGDPSLYDSTLAILDSIRERGAVTFEHRVIPGISSVQALAAQHRIPLNDVGGAVQVMPGRRLRDAGWPDGVDHVVVVLDASASYRTVADQDVEIFWGAYVGSPDELLVSGPLTEGVMAEIERTRSEARERKGWIMDTYVLRRRNDR